MGIHVFKESCWLNVRICCFHRRCEACYIVLNIFLVSSGRRLAHSLKNCQKTSQNVCWSRIELNLEKWNYRLLKILLQNSLKKLFVTQKWFFENITISSKIHIYNSFAKNYVFINCYSPKVLIYEPIKMKIILLICLGLNWHGVAAEDGASGAAEETIQQLFLREPNDQVSANNQWIAKFKVP